MAIDTSIKKTSKAWGDELHMTCKILDPDGWDRGNFNFSFYMEKVTKEEFFRRFSLSTVSHSPHCRCWNHIRKPWVSNE